MGRRRNEKRHGKFAPKAGQAHHHVPDTQGRLIATHPTRSHACNNISSPPQLSSFHACMQPHQTSAALPPSPPSWSRRPVSSPTRPLLALAVGPAVRILDYSQGAAEAQPLLSDGLAAGHTATVRLVLFSPDGSMLLTACDQRLVRLWDTTTWLCIATW